MPKLVPTPAGYSGTPLIRKLGFKAGWRVALLGAPAGFVGLLAPLPAGVTFVTARARDVNATVLFGTRYADVARAFKATVPRLAIDGMLWVAWPKKAAGVGSDLGEGDVREIGLACGLVDVKVCAIDATWSGLKFVRRLRDR